MLHSNSTHLETHNALITQKSKSCVFYHLQENFQLSHTWLQIETPNIIELYNRQSNKEYINYDFSHWLHTTASCWFLWTKIQIWNCKVSFEISLFKVVSKEFILLFALNICKQSTLQSFIYFLILNDKINIQLPARGLQWRTLN